MTYAIDNAEQVPYSATLAEATAETGGIKFCARPPLASPAQALVEARREAFRLHLAEAVDEAYEDGIEPSLSALENFDGLLRLLPVYLPLTEPYISASGSICLDWDFNPACQLSILLKDRNQVAYAAYFSGEKVHGSARFSHKELPEILAAVAKRWEAEVV